MDTWNNTIKILLVKNILFLGDTNDRLSHSAHYVTKILALLEANLSHKAAPSPQSVTSHNVWITKV